MLATRRRLLTASISLAMPCIRPAAAARRGITFAAYGGLFQELYEPVIVEPFRRTHRDISVFYQAFPSSTQALALLRRQREQPEIDVVLLDLAAARTATRIKAPINAQYGELDPRITGGWPAFDAALTQANVPHEGHIYKGANHGFHNDTTPRYDEAAAKEAWQRTLDWFDKYLRA